MHLRYKYVFLCLLVALFVLNTNIVKAACTTDYSGVDGNLIPNPFFECDEDANSIPDGWSKRLPDANHILSWVDDPLSGGHGKVIKSEYVDNNDPTDFGWLATDNIALDPNTWYELSITYLTENTGLNLTANKVNVSSNWIGAEVLKYNQAGVLQHFPPSHIFPPSQHLSSWDSLTKVFRTYDSTNSSGWQTKTIYFKSTQFDSYGIARTFNYPPGSIYIAKFSLKATSGNVDPNNISLARSGTLNTFTHKGASFFPIILSDFPVSSGQDLDLDTVKAGGFNTVPDSYRSMSATDYQTQLTLKDLAVMVSSNCLPWSNEYDCFWANDAGSLVNYLGYSIAVSHIDDWKDYANVVMFNPGLDEMDCNPQDAAAYPGYLDTFENLYAYIRSVTTLPLYNNFCGVDGYTNDYTDKLGSYLSMPDVFSSTANTPTSYDIASGANSGSAFMPRVGYEVRRGLTSLTNLGYTKKALAFGLGTYLWSSWDGQSYSIDEYIPFNLQRFQIWDQIINGATGVLFYVSGGDLDNAYYVRNFDQMKAIAGELTSLNGVLLEPTFIDGWQVSDSRINIMMKKYNGKIYLFTASTAQEDIENVTITLNSNYEIYSVTALGDVTNGDFTSPVDRAITPISPTTFTDSFVGETVSSPQGYNAPGYGVHIYEIEYGEVESSGNASQPGPPVCGDTMPPTPWIVKNGVSTKTTVTLGINGSQENLTGYALEYGPVSKKYIWGLSAFGKKDTKSLTINYLKPNTNYYITIRGKNGCAIGPASNELVLRTVGGTEQVSAKTMNAVMPPLPTPAVVVSAEIIPVETPTEVKVYLQTPFPEPSIVPENSVPKPNLFIRIINFFGSIFSNYNMAR